MACLIRFWIFVERSVRELQKYSASKMSSISKKPDWSPARKVKCLVFFFHLTSQADSFSVDSYVCSRLPFRLCHSVHTLAPFQSCAHVWTGFFFFCLWCWMVEVESLESLLLSPVELVIVSGLADPHVCYEHMHGCRQEAAPELTNTHTHTRLRYCCSIFHSVCVWVTRLPWAGLS